VKAAASNHEFTRKKKLRTEDLYKKNFVSQQASDQAATEDQLADMKLKLAQEQPARRAAGNTRWRRLSFPSAPSAHR
jgi:multidrug resistance efflux pump